jgi:hypothetical protein
MALGELTRQLAKQAIADQVTDILDPAKPAKAPSGGPVDNLSAVIVGQVQAMQKALKEDQELAVYCHTGNETIRATDIIVPGQVLVITGFDKDRNLTRVITPAESVQLTCKVLKVQPGATAARVNFIQPKAKPE